MQLAAGVLKACNYYGFIEGVGMKILFDKRQGSKIAAEIKRLMSKFFLTKCFFDVVVMLYEMLQLSQ